MTEAEARTIERLRAGAGTYACGGYLEAAARCGDTLYLSTTRFFEKTEQEGFSWI